MTIAAVGGGIVKKGGGKSLGEARTAIRIYLKNVENIPEAQLIRDIESLGFQLKTPPDAPLKVYQRGERDGLRVRIDPPQGKTRYNHLHIEYGGSSYSKFLKPVSRESGAAHIRRK